MKVKRHDWREKYLQHKIKNKKVLDLGVGDTSDRSLHKFIAKNAKLTTGVELDPSRAKKLRKQGYNVIIGNAETIKLDEKFDIIIAGDLIEHLNNVGLFLETIKVHLKPQGTFIFNTPNAYSINFIIRSIIGLGHVKQFPEHTYLFTEDLLKELFQRHNLKISKTIYFSHANKNIKSKIIRFFALFSKYWNENMLFEVKKK